MPNQWLEVLPMVGHRVAIKLVSGEVIRMPHARIQQTNEGFIHAGRIKRNSPETFPFICSTKEVRIKDIHEISLHPLQGEPALVLRPPTA